MRVSNLARRIQVRGAITDCDNMPCLEVLKTVRNIHLHKGKHFHLSIH
jgi:hypothetical protein